MANLLPILDQVGLLVGGTQPDAANSPHFYSGVQVGDGTGVSGIQGCYSIPPETLPDPPLALLIPEGFRAQGAGRGGLLTTGAEEQEDIIRISVLLWRNDLPTQYALLVPFRDSIPSLFRSHLQLGGLASVLDAFVTDGRTGLIHWAGNDYIGWEFALRVRSLLPVTYSS